MMGVFKRLRYLARWLLGIKSKPLKPALVNKERWDPAGVVELCQSIKRRTQMARIAAPEATKELTRDLAAIDAYADRIPTLLKEDERDVA